MVYRDLMWQTQFVCIRRREKHIQTCLWLQATREKVGNLLNPNSRRQESLGGRTRGFSKLMKYAKVDGNRAFPELSMALVTGEVLREELEWRKKRETQGTKRGNELCEIC